MTLCPSGRDVTILALSDRHRLRIRRSLASRLAPVAATRLCYDVMVRTESKPGHIIDLILDPERFRRVEPRIVASDWLPGAAPATVGSVARIEVRVQFALPILTRLFGNSVAFVEVTRVAPGQRIRLSVIARLFDADIDIQALNLELGPGVRVRARISPRTPVVGIPIARLQRTFETRGRAAIIRGVRRADLGLIRGF